MLLLYHRAEDTSGVLLLHLHSTMLLLYLLSENINGYDIHHLHSTMLLLYHRDRQMFQASLRFTFHYASTLSLASSFIQSAPFVFTFHYASTLSPMLPLRPYLQTNLHSTMLLLYPYFSGCM